MLQTILVGDSGVGKTSLLVQFDQGKFQTGSFAATVGIGFTVRHVCECLYQCSSIASFAPTNEWSANKLSTTSLDFHVVEYDVVSADL